jgi:hypothetical protein
MTDLMVSMAGLRACVARMYDIVVLVESQRTRDVENTVSNHTGGKKAP